ncbi:hypothetical protein N657DRAFT_669108 [Parathielavia appendiculata]|uniref:Nuclear pore assembly and biogenesis-domain-containing protein n=1 Tax=Parathielavia appendiculata TaxID=2587402 RepID=A0AAN6Z7K0_9PEZI|nr:hypothetical protein N657DRAFT_669108 [Parathielavia appendiculata]
MQTMDDPLHRAFDFVHDFLPPGTLTTLQTYLLNPSSPLHNLRRSLTALAAEMLSLLTPLLDYLAAFLSNSPTIVAATATLLIAVLILQILSIVKRIMLFWTRLAFRLMFYAVIGVAASIVWQRGVERTIRDAVVVGSQVGGWMAGVVSVWWEEYQRAQAAQAQAQQSRGAYGGYGGHRQARQR